MFHKIIIVGHLGRDPEMRYTPQGTPVTSFSVATSRKWTGQDGQTHDETVWWRVSAWGKQAEICNQFLAKGRAVLVEGRMRADERGNPRVFQRQDGSYGASYELTAETVRFLGGRGEAAEAPGAASFDEPPAPSEPDIPF